MKTVFVNCNLLDGTLGMTVRPGCAVWVDGDRIAKITDGAQDTSGWNVRDMKGAYVLPGLINAHGHMFGTGRPSKVLSGGGLQKALMKVVGTPFGRKIVDALVASSAKAELMSGVTTMRTCGDMQYSDVRIRDAIAEGRMDGPRLFVSGPAITVPGGHGDGTISITADTEEGLRECVRINHEHKVDYIKICVTGGVMDATKEGEPGEVKMSFAQTKAVTDEAHKLGYKVASHTESPGGMTICIDAGVDSIEHGAYFDNEHAEKLKAYDDAVVPTFSPALPICRLSTDLTKMPPVAVKNGEIVVQGMVNAAQSAMKYGVKLGCGTDASCPFCTQYNTWREGLYFTKMLGVDNAFALYTLTLGNAKVLGLDGITGSVEEGKCADLLFVKDDPLKDNRALSLPLTVVARGRIYDAPKQNKNEQTEEILDRLAASI